MVEANNNAGSDFVGPHSNESSGGLLAIAILILVVGCLVASCGLLWAECHDVRLTARIDARMKVMEARAKAVSALQEAKILRDKNEALCAALDAIKIHGGPDHKVNGTALCP